MMCENNIDVGIITLQKQLNNDCGLFAIAFAMAICNDQQPEEQQFDTTIMRRHLLGCLKDKQMRHFPGQTRRLKSHIRKSEKVEVFCSCRLPEEGTMICCDCCDEWFHEGCVTVPASIKNKDCSWNCDQCELMIKYTD